MSIAGLTPEPTCILTPIFFGRGIFYGDMNVNQEEHAHPFLISVDPWHAIHNSVFVVMVPFIFPTILLISLFICPMALSESKEPFGIPICAVISSKKFLPIQHFPKVLNLIFASGAGIALSIFSRLHF